MHGVAREGEKEHVLSYALSFSGIWLLFLYSFTLFDYSLL